MVDLERRSLIKITSAAAAWTALPPMMVNAAPRTHASLRISERQCQIVVMGGGVAGVMAALAASQQGARTLLMDKSALGLGGMSPWARYWMDVRGREAAILDDLDAMPRALVDPAWRDATLHHAAQTAELWEKWGWTALPPLQRRKTWLAQLQAAGVQLIERMMVVDLLHDAHGQFAGLLALNFDDSQNVPELMIIRANHGINCMGAGALRGPSAMLWGLTHDSSAVAWRAGAHIRGKEFTDLTSPYPRYACFEDAQALPPAYMVTGEQLSLQGLDIAAQIQVMRGDAPSDKMPPAIRMVGTGVLTSEGVVASPVDGAVKGVAGLHAAGGALASMVAGDQYAMPGLAFTASGAQGLMVGRAVGKCAQSLPPSVPAPDILEAAVRRAWAPRTRAQGYSPAWLRQNLQQSVMPFFISYSKDAARLQSALALVNYMAQHLQPMLMAASGHELRAAHELENILCDQQWRLMTSLARTESRGTHLREDCPLPDDAQSRCWIDVVRSAGGVTDLRTTACA